MPAEAFPPADKPLTIKEVCFVFRTSRWTLWRRMQEGCPFVGGRIPASVYAWWMREREMARRAGMTVREWLALPASERVKRVR